MSLRVYDQTTTLQDFLDSIQEMIRTGEITQSDLCSPFGLEDYVSFSLVRDWDSNLSIGYDDEDVEYVDMPASLIFIEEEFIEDAIARGTSEEED